jgi:hypothetical protein
MGWGDVLGGIGDFLGAKEGEKAAKKAARMERKMTEEEVRRLEYDQASARSMVDVIIGGTGFTKDSVSHQLYREEFERLQKEEVDWLKLVGQSRYDARKAEQKAYKYQGYASLARVVGTSIYLPSEAHLCNVWKPLTQR